MGPLHNAVIGGRFQLGRLLGLGAHARVYAAYDAVRRGPVALKLYNDDALDAITAEAASHFRVADCAAVFPLYDVLPDLVEGPATSMPIASGTLGDFQDVFASQAIDWAQRVLTALEFCHGRQVVHGDVKPSNVFLDDHRVVRLGDFGVADFMPNGQRGHTLEYAAPELVADGARNSSTDVWAAAVTLYELLCGELPFGSRLELGEDAVADRITAGAFPDPLTRRPYLPRRFRSFFRDAFAVDPRERALSTAAGMKQALADIPVRCEWVRTDEPGRAEVWEGHEVSAAGQRTGVVYVGWLEPRPRLGITEARLTKQRPNRRAQGLPGLGTFSGSEAQARQRLYARMRKLTAGADPRD